MIYWIVFAAIYVSGWASTTLMLGAVTMIKKPLSSLTKTDVWIWFGLSSVWPVIVWITVAAAVSQDK